MMYVNPIIQAVIRDAITCFLPAIEFLACLSLLPVCLNYLNEIQAELATIGFIPSHLVKRAHLQKSQRQNTATGGSLNR